MGDNIKKIDEHVSHEEIFVHGCAHRSGKFLDDISILFYFFLVSFSWIINSSYMLFKTVQ